MTRTKRSFTSRFKAAIPAAHARAKNINKRIRQQVLEFEQLSERNSKHLYIERCQVSHMYTCACMYTHMYMHVHVCTCTCMYML